MCSVDILSPLFRDSSLDFSPAWTAFLPAASPPVMEIRIEVWGIGGGEGWVRGDG